ncbi:hypothetical protein DL98DRAFT_642522 [Cadophora sp. DSE1049]|nr:hypothetical protein DL98DRAFT_642522 [Cadophora sp. DSE1049]
MVEGRRSDLGVLKKILDSRPVSTPYLPGFFPEELRHGLETFDLPKSVVDESLACAWEYSRCVIPHWTNWERYLAFNRTIIIAIIAEFRGDLIPESPTQSVVGYDLGELLSTLFGGTSMHQSMSREFKTFILISAEKSSKRLDSKLCSRYLHALTESPQSWFRLRDCDALARYTIASALACNDFHDVLFSENQWQLIAELGDTLYDAVAFFKHRAEGETNSTFGYVGEEMRVESFRLCREVLWALDVAWARDPAKRCILNFTRSFGGPIHMTTRRYRFVEDGLMIGRPESEEVVELTRSNFKLWNRVEDIAPQPLRKNSYRDIIAQSDGRLFTGFSELLERSAKKHCSRCFQAASNCFLKMKQFGGIRLCEDCKEGWRSYMRTFPERFSAAFPEVSLTSSRTLS